MKPTVLAALAVLPLAATGLGVGAVPAVAAERVVPVSSAGSQPLPDRYIVTTKPGTAQAMVSRFRGTKNKVTVYSSVLSGFAATLDADQLKAVQRDQNVLRIERDQVVRVSEDQQDATWGLDRIDQAKLPLDTKYAFAGKADNVTAYVIDTGIAADHPDFGGRAKIGHDATGGDGKDCHGHGTHVAGTIAGAKHGVAKGAKVVGVRVLSCSGSGSTAGVIAGMDWVRQNATKPAVANMSLGGGKSQALNDAADKLAESGVFLAVAAGNDRRDACTGSPASAPGVTSVAASDKSDNKAQFTNFGKCAHLYAPGVDITSAWLNGATKTISGTSMASPHVAGVGALYKAAHPDASAKEVREWLTSKATADVIQGNPADTPNRLLFKADL